MEEAGIDWSCKTCKEQVATSETLPTSQEETMDTGAAEPTPPPPAHLSDEGSDHEMSGTTPTPLSAGRRARATARRRPSGETTEKPKAKAVRCHMCSKPPRVSSIYCSGERILLLLY